MASEKPHIMFPSSSPNTDAPSPRARTRLVHILAELLLTITVSFTILLVLLRMLGIAGPAGTVPPPYIAAYPAETSTAPIVPYRTYLPAADPTFPDASMLGILRVTVVCTILVYAAVEGGAALLRRMRRRRVGGVFSAEGQAPSSYGSCTYDGMRALEAGWAPIFAINDGKKYPREKVFAIVPGGSGRARSGL
ncbi:hypothetical protein B0H11DRAFT_2112074 [Mycena galericulata]|nr:hypothetical protein B0H11DRAFT_2121332 [Mycena galericulata]KAJ7436007.1 hypothetical protein B0H11DRAFT_2112074 [Mycena galericulata]